MNPLDLIFGQVANVIKQHSSPNTPGPAYDSNPLLGALSGIFGQHASQIGGGQFNGYDPNADYSQHGGYDHGQLFGGQDNNYGNAISSDQDPYGDPGLQGGAQDPFNNAISSDHDPYGDPGLQGR